RGRMWQGKSLVAKVRKDVKLPEGQPDLGFQWRHVGDGNAPRLTSVARSSFVGSVAKVGDCLLRVNGLDMAMMTEKQIGDLLKQRRVLACPSREKSAVHPQPEILREILLQVLSEVQVKDVELVCTSLRPISIFDLAPAVLEDRNSVAFAFKVSASDPNDLEPVREMLLLEAESGGARHLLPLLVQKASHSFSRLRLSVRRHSPLQPQNRPRYQPGAP
ncbi:unnamed protein product, partial [Symbiodinium sp. CCMP2456]